MKRYQMYPMNLNPAHISAKVIIIHETSARIRILITYFAADFGAFKLPHDMFVGFRRYG